MDQILTPTIGGVIIGIATTVMLLFNGKITGISGIINRSLAKPTHANDWRYAFLIGLIIGGAGMYYVYPEFFQYEFKQSTGEIIIAGLLVGFGTLLGNGCTSGHGVCGLPRLSMRSLVAVIMFMGFAILTVFIRGLL